MMIMAEQNVIRIARTTNKLNRDKNYEV